ncbi:MFS transporter [Pseudaestuariivita atlantica]|uniref:MFS transporter n=1 Tax=Pseudaestuariivita atlantica TaxID=1317121 RepID=A0A0L1JPX0_9RHOB|nr:MFS transporter [Pseudaestuariivita atlantica]
MFFDWAQQPYATLGLTFIFSPYFAAVAADMFMAQGMAEDVAKANAQATWSGAQTIAGLIIAFTAPFLGAWAGATGRKMPWFYLFTVIAVICSASLWYLMPDGTGLMFTLLMFWIGYIAAESAFNLNNAILPTLGDPEKVGRISGGATAFGYWGGVLALFLMLLLFAENDQGVTLLGNPPPFGLDAEAREGTRLVGPFIALWFAIFMIPYFMWVRDVRGASVPRPKVKDVLDRLWTNVRAVFRRRSYASFLFASMFYRDALTAVYSFGGIYARLVLGWDLTMIGIFGIIAAIAAAILSWVGGMADQRLGPKPVIVFCCWMLILVSTIVVGMSRESLLGIPLAEGSIVPDVIFFVCGAIIGGAGGAMYSASRSMMVRHCTAEDAADAFGLFALTGRATAFLAPALITLFTYWFSSNQLGFLPVIFLFLLGLILLRWVQAEGDRAVWSETSSSSA